MEPINHMFNPKEGLTDQELSNYFKKNNIPFNEIKTMKDLDKMKTAQSLVYSGSTPDDVNKGNTHHWLYAVKPDKDKTYLFDSYGQKTAYNDDFLNKNNIKFINRAKLQEYGSNVCGPYCAAFAKYLNNQGGSLGNSFDPTKLINGFYEQQGMSRNARANDEKIKQFWNENVAQRY